MNLKICLDVFIICFKLKILTTEKYFIKKFFWIIKIEKLFDRKNGNKTGLKNPFCLTKDNSHIYFSETSKIQEWQLRHLFRG